MVVVLMALIGIGLGAGFVAAHPHRKSPTGRLLAAGSVMVLALVIYWLSAGDADATSRVPALFAGFCITAAVGSLLPMRSRRGEPVEPVETTTEQP
ncbi:hypothetical protein [Puerhibacterium sp. TATVAM-FAB25]|uniref:hypothetical protein n=1 Tax=Puerhibacterium sp. TATVAM-FAB25 TaxID=3093699 RepID=UPI00397BCBCD